MKPAPTLLAIDVGTQSVRALLLSAQGHVLVRSQVPIDPPWHAPQPGWAEQDALVYWRALQAACAELDADPATMQALCLSCQRGTVLCAAEDGTPLAPAIVWPDKRLCSAPPRLALHWEGAFRAAGARGVLAQLQSQAEANWLAQHEPALWKRADRFVLLSGWLTHQLTGAWIDSTGCQVGYLPFDYRRQVWAGPRGWQWQALAVRPSQLPRLVAPGNTLGALSQRAAAALGLRPGLPVVAGAADKACEMLGCGVLDASTLHLSLGTAATAASLQPRYCEVQRLLPAYPAALPGAFHAEVQIARGFWLVSWFLREFGQPERERAAALGVAPESLLDALLHATPPGADGLVLQPHWLPGLREPGAEARGTVLGWHEGHGRAHLYRALIEGLAFALRAGREQIEARTGTRFTRLVVSGGGSRSDAVVQIVADVLQLAAERPVVNEASALGAAMLGAAGAGLHADTRAAVAAMARTGRTTAVQADAARMLDRTYREIYAPLYARVRPLFERMRGWAPPGTDSARNASST